CSLSVAPGRGRASHLSAWSRTCARCNARQLSDLSSPGKNRRQAGPLRSTCVEGLPFAWDSARRHASRRSRLREAIGHWASQLSSSDNRCLSTHGRLGFQTRQTKRNDECRESFVFSIRRGAAVEELTRFEERADFGEGRLARSTSSVSSFAFSAASCFLVSSMREVI